MSKIAIIGSPGAGKTTLALALGEILQIDVIHLDRYFWHKNWRRRKLSPKRIQQQEDLIQKESWIIDGSYHGTLDLRLQAADTVIFLDMPRLLCLKRVIWRHFSKAPRPDLGKKCHDRLDWLFIKGVLDFPRVDRPILISKIRAMEADQKVTWLYSRNEVSNFLRAVRETQAIPVQQVAFSVERELACEPVTVSYAVGIC